MKRLTVFILAALLLFVGRVSVTKITEAQTPNARIVTVHIDGRDRTIATNASTVAEALKNLPSPLGENDKTEPSRDTPIVSNDFTINVYRARQISVVDGANSYTVMTAERSPEQIAKQAGFQTSAEDQYAFTRTDNPFDGSPGTNMVIKRAKNIILDLYGTSSPVRTNEYTVADFLQSRGITLENGDELNVPEQTRVTEGMTIAVAQVTRNVETVEEVAPFPEQQIKDVNQPTSYRKVQTPGQDGKKLVTYETVSKNGGEPERRAIKEVITVQPVTQVVVVGTQNRVPYTGGGSKTEWLIAAGVPESDWGYADFLVGKESGWNPNAVNRNSGACGLAQALPCSKVPGNPLNPVDSLRWMNSYVGRYGGWAGAYDFWMKNHWY